MAHEYRHILSAKRGGRGHDPDGGIEETKYGELALLCPACPHRLINYEIVELLREISPELADAYEYVDWRLGLEPQLTDVKGDGRYPAALDGL